MDKIYMNRAFILMMYQRRMAAGIHRVVWESLQAMSPDSY